MFVTIETKGLIDHVMVQIDHIIMVYPLKSGGCRIQLDPTYHEVTEFDSPCDFKVFVQVLSVYRR